MNNVSQIQTILDLIKWWHISWTFDHIVINEQKITIAFHINKNAIATPQSIIIECHRHRLEYLMRETGSSIEIDMIVHND